MRLDKWLKIALIFKQRSKAVTAINNNQIKVNGELAKAGKIMKVGDKVCVKRELGEYIYTIDKIMEKNVTRELAREMYTLMSPEQNGTEKEKILKKIERIEKQENRKDWNKMYDNKKKQRQLRSYKYQ